jgi:hypothetical protein
MPLTRQAADVRALISETGSEGEAMRAAQFMAWVKQASQLPGETL